MLDLQLDARGDFYHVTDTPVPLPSDSIHVARAFPMLRSTGAGRSSPATQAARAFIVEPIAQLIVQPYGGNPVGIPNEDSATFELDENNIFSFDQLPGYDLVESGPRANVGVTPAQQFLSGSIDALLGQTIASSPIRSSAQAPGQPARRPTSSAAVSMKFPPYIDLTDRIDVDRTTATCGATKSTLPGFTDAPPSGQLRAAAAEDGDTLRPCRRAEEINAQATINFYKNWQAFGAHAPRSAGRTDAGYRTRPRL